MTISGVTTKNQYNGNGSNTVFNYTFRILDEDDIQVVTTVATTGADTVKTIDTHYTVTGVGASGGGTVVFLTAPASTVRVTLTPKLTTTQEESYPVNGAFSASAHETALDRQALISQKLEENLGRAVTVPVGTLTTFDTETPAIVGNGGKVLRINSGETGFEWATSSSTVSGSGISSIDGVSNSGGDVDLIAGAGMTITPDDSANTITFASSITSGFATLNSVSNTAGNVDLVAGTAMTITPNDGANQITITFTPSGLAADSISGDKIDGGTISNFKSTGMSDTATSTKLYLTDSSVRYTTDFRIENTDPTLTLEDTNASADEKNVRLSTNSGVYQMRFMNDAKSSSSVFFQADRTGMTIDEVEINATLLDFNGAMDLSGAATIGGDVSMTSTGKLAVPNGTTAQRPGSPANGDIRYNTTSAKFEGYQAGSWTNIIAGAGSVALDDLTDVVITTPAHNAVLKYSTTTGAWYDDTISAGVSAIDDLTDVSITGAANGEVLTWNTASSQWKNTTPGTLTIALDGCTDVSATTPAKGDVIMWNGTDWEKTSTVLNVKSFSAVADNSTDCATPFNNAITAAQLLTNGGVIYVPAGKYVINTTISKTLTAPITIKGDGSDVTTIRWTGGTHGFDFAGGTVTDSSIDNNFITFEGLTLSTSQAGSGSAIQVDWTAGAGNIDRTFSTRDVIMRGESHTTHYWSKGVDSFNCRNAYLEDTHVFSKRGATLGVGFYFNGNTAGSPVDNIMTGCSAYWCDKAIEVDTTFEGLYVDQCRFIVCNYGIYWDTDDVEPLLTVTGSHMNCYKGCIYGNNLIQPIITGNLLYQPSASNENWVGIELTGTSVSTTDFINIQNNTIHWFSGSGSKNGIAIQNKSKGIIKGNIIYNIDTGIWLQSGSANLHVLDNYIYTYSTDILDSGTNNVVRRISTLTSTRGALVYRTSAQSISNNTWTTVQFNGTDYDTSSIFGSSTRLTVPSGVTKVRLRANIMWATPSSVTGGARATITKNGVNFEDSSSSSYIGQPHADGTNVPGNNADLSVNLSTPILTVVAGNYFEVRALQNTGSAIDLAPTNTKNANMTWFSMEIVE